MSHGSVILKQCMYKYTIYKKKKGKKRNKIYQRNDNNDDKIPQLVEKKDIYYLPNLFPSTSAIWYITI